MVKLIKKKNKIVKREKIPLRIGQMLLPPPLRKKMLIMKGED
jgi:hypothetical protein